MGGFIVCEDGRALAPSTGAWGLVLQKIAQSLRFELNEPVFADWLCRLSDAPAGMAKLDLRELTPASRDRFHSAARRAVLAVRAGGSQDWPTAESFDSFMKLFELLPLMKESIDRGEPPMALNPQMSAPLEPRGRICGPGWLEHLKDHVSPGATRLPLFNPPILTADLSDNSLPEGCLGLLRMLPRLEFVDLSRTGVTFSDLLQLVGHPAIKSVCVAGVPLSADERRELQERSGWVLTGETSES
jgi:hypothetical protein